MKNPSLKIFAVLSAAILMAGSVAFGACAEGTESDHEHVFGEWTETMAATCEKNGTKTRYCIVPGCSAKDETDIPATGHSWGLPKVTEAATCEHGGTRTKQCENCGATTTETTDPIDHDWIPTQIITAATCTTGGREVQKCSMCQEERTIDTDKLGHDWGPSVLTEAATCEKPGIAEKTCQRKDCGATETETIPKLNHQWRNTAVITPATCDSDGQQEQTCQRPNCGEKRTVTIERLGHSWQSYYTVDRRPTFDTAGSKSYHCNRCGAHKEDVPIPQLEENTPITYEFRTVRNTGQLLQDSPVTIVVKDKATGAEAARSTRETLSGGVFSTELLPKEYTVTIEDIPAGYSAGSEYTVTPYDPYCNVYLTASPISGTFTGAYKKGMVMYDFSVPSASTTAEVGSLKAILQTKKMVLLNFWYANCTFCIEEFPGLENAYTEYQDSVEVLGINCPQAAHNETGSMSEIRTFGTQNRLTFPLIQNAAVDLMNAFGVIYFPTSVLIDAEGVICEIFSGGLTQSEFETLFAKYTADDYLRTPDAEPSAAAQTVRAEALSERKYEI